MKNLIGVYSTNSLVITPDGYIQPSNSASELIKRTFNIFEIPDFSIGLRWDINTVHFRQRLFGCGISDRLLKNYNSKKEEELCKHILLQKIYQDQPTMAVLSPLALVAREAVHADLAVIENNNSKSLVTLGPYKLSPLDIIIVPHGTAIPHLLEPSINVIFYHPQQNSLLKVVEIVLNSLGVPSYQTLQFDKPMTVDFINNNIILAKCDENASNINLGPQPQADIKYKENIDIIINVLECVSELCVRIVLGLHNHINLENINLQKVIFANLTCCLQMLLDNLNNNAQKNYIIDKFISESHWLNLLLLEMKFNVRGISIDIAQRLQQPYALQQLKVILKDLPTAISFIMQHKLFNAYRHERTLHAIDTYHLLFFLSNGNKFAVENKAFSKTTVELNLEHLNNRILAINEKFAVDGYLRSFYSNVVDQILYSTDNERARFSNAQISNLFFQHRVLNLNRSPHRDDLEKQLTQEIKRRKLRLQ